jgi:hypothetical protein
MAEVYLTTPSDTSTDAPGVVGEIREHIDATYGRQFYRLVKADGADLAANIMVKYSSGSSVLVVKTGAAQVNNGSIAGATQNIIPNGKYGWVVCGGQCGVLANAAIAANAAVATHGTAGKVDDATVTEGTTVGIAPSAISSGAVGTIRLWAMM